MFNKFLILSALSLSLIFTACSDDDNAEEANSMISGKEYALKTLDNKTIKIHKEGNQYSIVGDKSKLVIFDLFATWCPPCRATAPHLASLQKKYPDDILILGTTIETDKTNAQLKAFKEKYGANYTLVNGMDNLPLARSIAGSTGVGQSFPIPLMVMYKDGKYITHYVGAVQEEMIEADIKKALGK